MVKFISAISALAATAYAASVVDLTADNFDASIKDKDLALVKFFAPWCGHCKSMANDWEAAAEKLKDNDQVIIANVDCTENRDLCGSQSVQGYPTLKAFKKGVFSEETYDRKEAAIVSYVNKVLGGGSAEDEAAAALNADDVKSEDVPSADAYGADNVWKIVGKNFNEQVINNDKHIFLKVYAPWCGHCVAMKENWEKLAKSLENNPNVVIAEIDATANELPTAYTVRGFPTIFWCDKGNKNVPEKYQGARSVEAWTEFVNQKVGGKDEL